MDEQQSQIAKLNQALGQMQRVIKHLETQRNEAHTASIEKSVAADIMQESLQRKLGEATLKIQALQEALKAEIDRVDKASKQIQALSDELEVLKTGKLDPRPSDLVTNGHVSEPTT